MKDDLPFLPRAVQLDEEDRLPAAKEQPAIADGYGLGGIHEEAHQMSVRVLPIVHGIEIVAVATVARDNAMKKGDHVRLQHLLPLVQVDVGGRMGGNERHQTVL